MTNEMQIHGVQRDADPGFGTESDENKHLSQNDDHGTASGWHTGHAILMLACCIPMLVIAVVLVVSGVASFGFVITAVACTAMMFVMMRMMPGH